MDIFSTCGLTHMCYLTWGCWLGGAVPSTLQMNVEQQQMGKGHIRTMFEQSQEPSHNIYCGYQTMVNNNH